MERSVQVEMTNTIDERFTDLPAGTSVPMDALFNGDTHRERLAALAGALSDEQVEHALHVLALDAAGQDGTLPAGVADYTAAICRRYEEVRYALTMVGLDGDGEAQIWVMVYIDSAITRDGKKLTQIFKETLPRRYRYLDMLWRVWDMRGQSFEGSWWQRRLDAALGDSGSRYAVYERAGGSRAAASAAPPTPAQAAGAVLSERWVSGPVQKGDLVWVNDQGDLIAGLDLAKAGADVLPAGIWMDGKVVRAGHIVTPYEFRIDVTEDEDDDEQ